MPTDIDWIEELKKIKAKRPSSAYRDRKLGIHSTRAGKGRVGRLRKKKP
jgi:hypothetical protein